MKPREAMLCSAANSVQTPNTAVITFEGREEWELDLIGCNLRNSGCRKSSNVSLSPSFTVVIQRGQTGIAAVYCRKPVKLKNHTTSIDYSFLVGIVWRENSTVPVIDLDKNWIFSNPDRIGAIRDSQLEVNLGGITISTGDERFKHTSGDLICQYLVGDISADELAAGAKLDQTAQNHLASVNALNKQIHLVLEHNTALTKSLGTAGLEIDQQRADITNLNNTVISISSMLIWAAKDILKMKDEDLQKFGETDVRGPFNLFLTGILEERKKVGEKVLELDNLAKLYWWQRPKSLKKCITALMTWVREKNFFNDLKAQYQRS